jgi:1,4-alpha-glucan branching enzyme
LPFLFFCDLGEDLRTPVREGRRREFAGFPEFADPLARARIPDPTAVETFINSKLDWTEMKALGHAEMLAWTREILVLRRLEIIPRLAGTVGGCGRILGTFDSGLALCWTLGDGSRLTLLANLAADAVSIKALPPPVGRRLFATEGAYERGVEGRLAPWSVAFFLDEPAGEA